MVQIILNFSKDSEQEESASHCKTQNVIPDSDNPIKSDVEKVLQ